MKQQHKQYIHRAILLALEGGQRPCLCCNSTVCRCSPSGSNTDEDIAMEKLAAILVELFLNEIQNERKKHPPSNTEPGGNLC